MLLIIYCLCINFMGIWIMKSDKHRAKTGKWRVPERVLFLIAIFGGSIGMILGMELFRHKTKHWCFRLGMPVILMVQVLIFYMVRF